MGKKSRIPHLKGPISGSEDFGYVTREVPPRCWKAFSFSHA